MSHSERRDQHFWACITLLIGILVGVVVTLLMLSIGMDWGYQIAKEVP